MEDWLKYIIEIQSLAQAGIYYTKDEFDKERYNRLREISGLMLSLKSNENFNKIEKVFLNETGYQTPKIDTRAAVIKDNRILLVKEKNGLWTLPGGWCDVLESVRSNTIKEVKEETGIAVEPLKIIAIQDRNKHNKPIYGYGVCKIFVLCKYLEGKFIKNIETIETNFFEKGKIPDNLDIAKTTKDQIEMCFQAEQDEFWLTKFDWGENMSEKDIYDLLKKEKIAYQAFEHEKVYTMDDLNKIMSPHKEAYAKNIFIRDDKKKHYYLLSIKGNKKIDLKKFRTTYNTRPLSFATPLELQNILNLSVGSVTPLGLLNDKNNMVSFYIDKDLFAYPGIIAIHPLVNTATIIINTEDLIKIIKKNNHEVTIMDMEALNV